MFNMLLQRIHRYFSADKEEAARIGRSGVLSSSSSSYQDVYNSRECRQHRREQHARRLQVCYIAHLLNDSLQFWRSVQSNRSLTLLKIVERFGNCVQCRLLREIDDPLSVEVGVDDDDNNNND